MDVVALTWEMPESFAAQPMMQQMLQLGTKNQKNPRNNRPFFLDKS